MKVLALAALALTACSGAHAATVDPASALRSTKSIAPSARFSASAACEPGELTLTRSTLMVPHGGATVVKITSCNASPGDRMNAYLSSSPSCFQPADSQIGTRGDGGSASDGSNIAIIAGSTPCVGTTLSVTDVTTGAVSPDVPIVVY